MYELRARRRRHRWCFSSGRRPRVLPSKNAAAVCRAVQVITTECALPVFVITRSHRHTGNRANQFVLELLTLSSLTKASSASDGHCYRHRRQHELWWLHSPHTGRRLANGDDDGTRLIKTTFPQLSQVSDHYTRLTLAVTKHFQLDICKYSKLGLLLGQNTIGFRCYEILSSLSRVSAKTPTKSQQSDCSNTVPTIVLSV